MGFRLINTTILNELNKYWCLFIQTLHIKSNIILIYLHLIFKLEVFTELVVLRLTYLPSYLVEIWIKLKYKNGTLII